jgi:hypothetical protein
LSYEGLADEICGCELNQTEFMCLYDELSFNELNKIKAERHVKLLANMNLIILVIADH